MTDKRDEFLTDDASNAVMANTTRGVMAEDFVKSNNDIAKEPEMQRESKNFWQDAWSQLKRNKLAVVGMIGLIIILILALVGPLMSSHDYAEQDVDRRNLPAKIPVLDQLAFLPFDGEGAQGVDAYKEAGVKENFWFGTDQLGRDLWSRTWQGAQVSLLSLIHI